MDGWFFLATVLKCGMSTWRSDPVLEVNFDQNLNSFKVKLSMKEKQTKWKRSGNTHLSFGRFQLGVQCDHPKIH